MDFLNRKEILTPDVFIPVDKHDPLLEDGDSIVFMVLLAGG